MTPSSLPPPSSVTQPKADFLDDYYQPPEEIINKYADVLINFALNSGEGVKPGEVVELVVPDIAKDMALVLQNTVLRAGAHPVMKFLPTGFEQDYYTLANDDQLTFFARNYWKARAKLLDHTVQIIADPYPDQLKDIKPHKIISARDAKKPYRDWLNAKENQSKFTWTIGLWGVPAKAAAVNLSLEAYWQQIIKACFLDLDNPIAKWREIYQLQEEIKQKLNALEIEEVFIEGDDAQLHLKIGSNRIWRGGSGRNIPSFEIFTSPDWRGSQGWIHLNEPVYRYGNIIRDVRLELKDGLVVKAEAKAGNAFLQEMLKSKNANKLGEFSLTDKRMSRITHPMAETLFDENMGGPYGNTHIAIGMAYLDCYRGKVAEVTKKQWAAMGFNDAAEHTDLVSTTDRVVTATLPNGTKKVIYCEGQFVV